MRPIWQSILDQELIHLACLALHLRRCEVVPRGFKQFRVDGICLQGTKKVCDSVLASKDLTYAELSETHAYAKHPWPKSECQEKVFGNV